MRRPMHYKPAGRSGWDCRAFDAESKKHNRALYEAYGDEQAEALIADAAASFGPPSTTTEVRKVTCKDCLDSIASTALNRIGYGEYASRRANK